jgi:D-amino peptidase
MRLFILSDAEGAAGVVNFWDYTRPEFRYYETTRRLVTLEINAAIEGALEAGVTEVYVADAHGPGAVNVELLHPAAKVLTGRPVRFPFGFDDGYDMLFMTGHHAKSNTNGGHLSHSWSMGTEEMWINGVSVGEIGTWLTLTGQHRVPVPLLTGDQAACDEIRGMTPGVHTVATQEGWRNGPANGLTEDGNRSHNGGAVHIHPERARELIREAASAAVRDHKEMPFFDLAPPYEVVTIMRPKQEGEPHLIGRGTTDDPRELVYAVRDYVPLEEDLAAFVTRMNEGALAAR